jgi:hypothetical protein
MKPFVDYFWVFGYITHVHVPKVQRTKLDNISFMCIFLMLVRNSRAIDYLILL